MRSRAVVTGRVLVVMAFLAAMPTLAIPVVGDWVTMLRYGSRQTESPERPDGLGSATAPTDAGSREAGTKVSELVGRTASIQQTAPRADPFQLIQQKLQRLGADYMRLELLSGTPPSYRFRCSIPLGGGAVYSRPFEAVAGDPLLAMERVLADVESWRAAATGRKGGV